jgi:hypothetical protein
LAGSGFNRSFDIPLKRRERTNGQELLGIEAGKPGQSVKPAGSWLKHPLEDVALSHQEKRHLLRAVERDSRIVVNPGVVSKPGLTGKFQQRRKL